jgi:hypothetical protein
VALLVTLRIISRLVVASGKHVMRLIFSIRPFKGKKLLHEDSRGRYRIDEQRRFEISASETSVDRLLNVDLNSEHVPFAPL